MAVAGQAGMIVAYASALLAACCAAVGAAPKRRWGAAAQRCAWVGSVLALLAAGGLVVSFGALAICFLVEDVSLYAVLTQRSHATGAGAGLYRVAGLWAGREGSLLLWTTVLGLCGAAVAVRVVRSARQLDVVALAVVQLVLVVLLGSLVLGGLSPFEPTPAACFAAEGQLTSEAAALGRSPMLDHWAMAMHPPALFAGYAGLVVPFAYAVAALVGMPSDGAWALRAYPFALFGWATLGLGIALGAVWAAGLAGWGGAWGWDPVENASLCPWLAATALVCSLRRCRGRADAGFARWGIALSCATFAFVMLGSLIARSGVVRSLHAYASDPASFTLFAALAIGGVAVGVFGLVARWRELGIERGRRLGLVRESKFGLEQESVRRDALSPKAIALHVANATLLCGAVLLACLTLAPALPAGLPLAGCVIDPSTYTALAVPFGVIAVLSLVAHVTFPERSARA